MECRATGEIKAIAKVKKRVLVVDDHPLVRRGVKALIDQAADMRVCGEVSEARAALGAVRRLDPDVVLLDISLRDGNGLTLIKEFRAWKKELPALVLSVHDEGLYAELALRAGGVGYIMKDEAVDSLLTAIRSVLEGKIFVSERIRMRLGNHLLCRRANGDRSGVDCLSPRELEVFQMIGEGRGTGEIAVSLGVGVRTVETHRRSIKEKLHLRSTAEVFQQAFNHVQGGAQPCAPAS